MTRRLVLSLLVLTLGLIPAHILLNSIGPGSNNLAQANPIGSNDHARELTIDVACDGRTYRQNNADPAASGSHRGDTFIVSGKIYPRGTIPVGKGVFSPDNSGTIGNWICRGVWLVSAEELANGASPAFDTSQIYLLPDDTKQIFSEGLEGPMPTLRAVIGGTGPMSGVSGEVGQELLGTNVTGLFNFRFTFRISAEPVR